MQTAGMLPGTRAIFLLVLLVPLVNFACALPLQVLPNLPGYIPVYIRHGDEPLININPALAEAFHETETQSKNIRLENSPSDIDPALQDVSEETAGNKGVPYSAVHVRQVEAGKSEISKQDGATAKKTRVDLARRKPIPFITVLKTSTNVTDENKADLELKIKEAENLEPTEANEERAIDVLSPFKVEFAQTDEKPVAVPLPLPAKVETSEENVSTNSEASDEEPPSKIQRPQGILSNVRKISQADQTENSDKQLLNKENTVEKDDAQINIKKAVVEFSSKQLENEDKAKVDEEDENPVKLQRPSNVLSNVHKISPGKTKVSETKEADDVPSS